MERTVCSYWKAIMSSLLLPTFTRSQWRIQMNLSPMILLLLNRCLMYLVSTLWFINSCFLILSHPCLSMCTLILTHTELRMERIQTHTSSIVTQMGIFMSIRDSTINMTAIPIFSQFIHQSMAFCSITSILVMVRLTHPLWLIWASYLKENQSM